MAGAATPHPKALFPTPRPVLVFCFTLTLFFVVAVNTVLFLFVRFCSLKTSVSPRSFSTLMLCDSISSCSRSGLFLPAFLSYLLLLCVILYV